MARQRQIKLPWKRKAPTKKKYSGFSLDLAQDLLIYKGQYFIVTSATETRTAEGSLCVELQAYAP